MMGLVLSAIALAGCSMPSKAKPKPRYFSSVQITPNVSMDAAAFGLTRRDVLEAYNIEEASRVPLKPGVGYGWRIHLNASKSSVRWKEEFVLPVAPQQWGKGDAKISSDRKISIVEKTETPVNGWIGNSWSVAEGDPKGTYVMKVYIDGELARTFEFVVE